MLHGVRDLKHYSIGAVDGHIGRVRDVYFDDERWAIRYLVVDTAHWLAGRWVLISPLSLRGIDRERKIIPASLTKAQVANSPDFDTEQPVSRRREVEFYRYYGLPAYYWMADEGQVPLVDPGIAAAAAREVPTGEEEHGDPHLRSVQAITLYQIHARDADIGHASDFLFDKTSWRIECLVVATGSWWPGRSVLVPVRCIERLDWVQNCVEVGVPSDAIRRAPIFDTSRAPTPEYLARLAAYYGVPARSIDPR